MTKAFSLTAKEKMPMILFVQQGCGSCSDLLELIGLRSFNDTSIVTAKLANAAGQELLIVHLAGDEGLGAEVAMTEIDWFDVTTTQALIVGGVNNTEPFTDLQQMATHLTQWAQATGAQDVHTQG